METTGPNRRRLLGILVMVGIPLLQLASEYLGTRDAGRFLSKAIVLLIGLPLLVVWGFAVFRWASRRHFSVVGPLFVGAGAAGLFFAGLLWATRAATYSIPLLRPHYGPWGGVDVLRVGFAMGLTSFAIWALAFVFPFAVEDARVRALEADKLRTQVELAQLRSHLEPHFLLNTLNAIAGLVTEDPRQARKLLGSLGDLLRDSVGPSAEMETLDAQIEWLRRYAQILETRHDGQLTFHWEIGDGTPSALLPRLLLQPLVENAVRHGIGKLSDTGVIEIAAVAVSGDLLLSVRDNGPGYVAASEGGVGLANTRARLETLFAEAAELNVSNENGRGTVATVRFPLRRRVDA